MENVQVAAEVAAEAVAGVEHAALAADKISIVSRVLHFASSPAGIAVGVAAAAGIGYGYWRWRKNNQLIEQQQEKIRELKEQEAALKAKL